MLAIYDSLSKQETVVLDEKNEIEVYSMTYNSKRDILMFSGLRFSDNRFVIVEISM